MMRPVMCYKITKFIWKNVIKRKNNYKDRFNNFNYMMTK